LYSSNSSWEGELDGSIFSIAYRLAIVRAVAGSMLNISCHTLKVAAARRASDGHRNAPMGLR
jgi:hypothetical protein